jgi:hypothetical protein
MATKRPAKPEPMSREEREARMQSVIAAVKKNKKIMDGVRESLEARRRGVKPVPFEQLKRKDA